LEELLGNKIIAREKLSHWPLSYVEKVTLRDDTQIIYKSQHSASSMELKFYSHIKAPYLASPIYHEIYLNCDIMVFPCLNYPILENVSVDNLEATVLCVSNMIQGIDDMPVFFDVSSIEKLSRLVDSVCTIFDDKDEVRNTALLKKWVSEKSGVCFENRHIGNVHGDLTASNILTDNGKPRYILDWQRPMKAPLALECALAYRLAGYDAVEKFGDFGLLAIICHFIWYAFACKNFIPFVYGNAHKLLLEIISKI